MIIINGISYHECFYCGQLTDKLFCECRNESKSKEITRILNTYRKRYQIPILVTPFTGGTK